MLLVSEKILAGQAYRSLSEFPPCPAHSHPPAALRRRGAPFTTPLLSGRVNGVVSGRLKGVVKIRCPAAGCGTHHTLSAIAIVSGAGESFETFDHRDAGVVELDEPDILLDPVGAWQPVGGEAR
jgi:hypothetical protein